MVNGLDRRRVILVVEDEPVLLDFEVEVLSDDGFEVLAAINGDEAAAILRSRGDVDLMITDVDMPGTLDGIALARVAREMRGDIRIIVVSGRAWLSDAFPEDARFMAKPYGMNRILSEAHSILGDRSDCGTAAPA